MKNLTPCRTSPGKFSALVWTLDAAFRKVHADLGDGAPFKEQGAALERLISWQALQPTPGNCVNQKRRANPPGRRARPSGRPSKKPKGTNPAKPKGTNPAAVSSSSTEPRPAGDGEAETRELPGNSRAPLYRLDWEELALGMREVFGGAGLGP